jgi:hypothetical protein
LEEETPHGSGREKDAIGRVKRERKGEEEEGEGRGEGRRSDLRYPRPP